MQGRDRSIQPGSLKTVTQRDRHAPVSPEPEQLPGHGVRICKDGTERETTLSIDRRRAMSNEEVYVGIDVSKDHLDVRVSSEARAWRRTARKALRRCSKVWAA